MRSLSEPVVWTNLLFFLNALLWLYAGLPTTAGLVAITAFASLSYHIFKESEPISKLIDHSCAYAALIWTLWVAHPMLSLIHIAVLATALVVGLIFKNYAHRTSYEAPHTYWHICVFIGQGVLAYACLLDP